MVKARNAGHGGGANVWEAAGVLQSIYQTLCALHRNVINKA
jgi:hypothetical protein